MAKLLRATGVAKAPAVFEFISDILETSAEKVVVFARHRDVITALEGMFKGRAVTYHGGHNDQQKTAAVNRFVNDKGCSVFIGQIQAAGTGINGLQTVCHTVVFAELSWVPGEMAQAIDRCHRIGQTHNEGVLVYMPHVPGTLESAMLQVQLGKEAVIERLMSAPVLNSAPAANNDLEGLV
jgi:SWI/SNF-related matrix-associated actin-dependent regulator 1 of chromatin subfamily A